VYAIIWVVTCPVGAMAYTGSSGTDVVSLAKGMTSNEIVQLNNESWSNSMWRFAEDQESQENQKRAIQEVSL